MADPARKLPEFAEATDPKLVDPRYPDARQVDPGISRPLDPANSQLNEPRVVESRGAGNGAVIAAIVVVLAILAYMFFAPGTAETPAPGDPAATTTTEPAPATDTNTMAPATPAEPAPAATPPAATDQPTGEAPAAPAPAAPAPAN